MWRLSSGASNICKRNVFFLISLAIPFYKKLFLNIFHCSNVLFTILSCRGQHSKPTPRPKPAPTPAPPPPSGRGKPGGQPGGSGNQNEVNIAREFVYDFVEGRKNIILRVHTTSKPAM